MRAGENPTHIIKKYIGALRPVIISISSLKRLNPYTQFMAINSPTPTMMRGNPPE